MAQLKNTSIDSTITVGSGSQEAPAIAFTSNTGIFSPGTDQIAFSTNGTERMRIDSLGRQTVTLQPAFNVFRNQNGYNLSANSIFAHNAARVNVGNHFNLSTHRFIAPVAGNYWFTFETIQIGNLSNGSISLRLNGSNISGSFRHFGNTTGGWITLSVTKLIAMNVNDFVDVICRTTTRYHGNNWNAFCGYLVG